MDRVAHPEWDADFFRNTFELLDMAVLVINHEFEVLYANQYVCDRIMGVPQHIVIGMSLPKHQTVPDEDMQRVIDHTVRVLERGIPERIENWALHKDGSRRLMYWSTVPKLNADGSVAYLLAAGMDVTEQRQEKHMLENLAHRDVLTELHNRSYFEKRLTEDFSRARHERTALALFYVDLDGFKPVNDQYGHETGDRVLCQVALRLRNGLRQNDIVCRIGGDEFAVILPGMALRKDAGKLAEDMIARLSCPYDAVGCSLQLGASVGIAFLSGNMQDSQDLVRRADAAMYQAKHSGKGRYMFAE